MTEQTPQQSFDLAVQHQKAGRLQEAVRAYRQVLVRQPRHADALHMLGVVLCQMGQHDAGLDLIRQAIAVKGDYPEACYNLANALRDRGQLDQAAVAYRRAIDLKPGFWEAYGNLGTVLCKLGQLDDAIAALKRAVAIKYDNANGHFSLGVALHQSGRLDQAADAFGRAIGINGNFPVACFCLGCVLKDQGKPDEAAAAFRRAIALKPDYQEAYCKLAGILHGGAFIDEGIAAARQAIALNPNCPESHYNLGCALKIKGNVEEAIASYRRSIALNPRAWPAYEALGEALECQEKIPEAIEAFRTAHDLAPSEPSTGYHLAAMGARQAPSAPPREYVARLFDSYAGYFDEHLVGGLNYHAPQLLHEAVTAAAPPLPMDILDLGCGTGLCGVLFRPMARRLTGVDLSPGMLQKSRQRGVYDELIEDDAASALRTRPQSADLSRAADVFSYVGALDDVFAAAAQALRPGGLFAFTIESLETGDYILRRTRRYAQSIAYVRRLAQGCRFTEVSARPVVLRKDQGQPVEGMVVVLRAAQSGEQ